MRTLLGAVRSKKTGKNMTRNVQYNMDVTELNLLLRRNIYDVPRVISRLFTLNT